MFQSIIDDIKAQFSYGNMITRIILVNLFIFLFIKIIGAFTPPGSELYASLINAISLPSEGLKLITKPWTIFTHMFVHEGFWHIAWNMILLYWFGRIAGDLGGDKRILPLYILGGLAGAATYFIYAQIADVTGIAYGASAAVTAIIVTAAFLAPDYIIHLILIGSVKLKYIAVALIVIDVIMISENSNTGGRFAHLGGALLGGYFVHMLRKGIDITTPIQGILDFFSGARPTKKKSPMKVVYSKKWPGASEPKRERTVDVQEKIDAILDKINATGYDSLNEEEKDFLYKVSQKE